MDDNELAARVEGYAVTIRDLRAQLAEAQADNARLRAALSPFAAFADAYTAKLRDEQAVVRDELIVYQFNDVRITVGMLRAARAALEDTTP